MNLLHVPVCIRHVTVFIRLGDRFIHVPGCKHLSIYFLISTSNDLEGEKFRSLAILIVSKDKLLSEFYIVQSDRN